MSQIASTRLYALRRAKLKAGGEKELARLLGCSVPQVRAMLEGQPIPDNLFLKTVDVLSDDGMQTPKPD